MLRLIRLELNKFRWGIYLRNAAIAAIVVALWCVTSIPNEDTSSYKSAFSAISSYARGTFIVFSSVLMSRMIIDEYRNKTAGVLFTYPINRKKLFIAKLALLYIITFSLLVLANGFVDLFFLLMDAQYNYIPESLTNRVLLEEAVSIVLIALASTGLSLIPFYFGMLRKSVAATITSSFILAMGFSSGIHLSWSEILISAIGITAVGIFMAALAIRNVETQDVQD
ncbi:MAG: transporter permease [Paenibacillus sp.]|jgi:ABC-type transport system involved in multi-copper enzyme maturation permease subunit|nr:transporter permease [Paenibacillus sp.]